MLADSQFPASCTACGRGPAGISKRRRRRRREISMTQEPDVPSIEHPWTHDAEHGARRLGGVAHCGQFARNLPDRTTTLTLASVLLLVLSLFGRAARNHRHF